MKLSVLGSGSAGNSVVFGSEDTGYWMVDAGLSAKQICMRLEAVGVNLEMIRGVFITHEHKDHIGGLRVLMKKLKVPVYASELTQEYLTSQMGMQAEWAIFEPGQRFTIDEMSVEAIRIPHDATDPVGFIFTLEDTRVGIVTDLGYVSDSTANRLQGVELLYLESNYDVKLLELDQKRPWSIKQRISSRHGHLSNEQARDLVQSLREHGLQKVAFGHLSRDCNDPDCIINLMKALPVGLDYEISHQDTPTRWLELAPKLTQTEVKEEKWSQPNLFEI